MSNRHVPRALRAEVARLARGCCEYCLSQLEFSPAPFSIEHIMARSQGGATELENLAFACEGCNGHKAGKTHAMDPASGDRVQLFHPRHQQWRDYFMWSGDYAKIAGRTPVGRATVDALQLNRARLQRLRRALWQAGAHPPEWFQNYLP